MIVPDGPIAPFKVPVLVLDGNLVGQTLEVFNDVHHYLAPGEYYARYSVAPLPTRELKSYFSLVTVGYRAVKPLTSGAGKA